jgi:uncharacterized protein (UPF0332 family)
MRESCTLLSGQFIETAHKRIGPVTGRTEADLRRAISDMYYAAFHRVCEALVETIGSDPNNAASVETYKTIYRLPDHGPLEKRCKEALSHAFAQEIKTFAQCIITLKNKRHDADYDPLAKFAISEVENDLRLARAALTGFENAAPLERARFAYFVALEGKRGKA